ncbi:hypothetical protein [Bacillus badius]|uniref:hypothetical protein n=1 Tax=Bacillus badius TaxID=1455 RepID=UPI0005970604|nr:hypothetical protein [Bacillus badius]
MKIEVCPQPFYFAHEWELLLSVPGRFAFRGAGGEPPRRQSACGVSPVPLIPPESSRLPFQSTGGQS